LQQVGRSKVTSASGLHGTAEAAEEFAVDLRGIKVDRNLLAR